MSPSRGSCLEVLRVLAAVAALALAAPCALAAGLQDGVAAYERKDYAEAVRIFRDLADKSDPDADAQVWIGYLYEKGRGVPKDEAQAVAWYRKAAERGYALGEKNLGVMYAEGRGVAQDDREALNWFRRAAQRNNAEAQVWIGYLYEKGRGVPKDEVQAVAWYRKAAEQGYDLGQKNLGVMYAEGRGVARDDRQAAAWFRRAAERNHADAQVWLGFMHERGRGVPKDEAQAVAWYRKAAEQGDALGEKNLGVMYAEGRGVAQDDREAARWFRGAAERNYADAQVWIGYLYEKGRGVPKDDTQAAAWYRAAAEQENAIGQANLALMYEHGRGVPRDLEQAVHWYRRSAENGDTVSAEALRRLTGQSVAVRSAEPDLRGPAAGGRREPAASIIAARPESHHALIIANRVYDKLRPLTTPYNDAEDLADLLVQKYGYLRQQVKVLRDARRVDIMRELHDLRTRLSERDSLLIYYAGHGRQDSATERGYWQPVDAEPDNEANWVAVDDITNQLKAMRAMHVLVIADSCYSGTLTRDDGVARTRVGGLDEWVARMMSRRSRTALTSGGLEPVLDRGGGRNSVFAKALLDVLRENPRAHDMDALFQQIKRKVVLNAQQTPVYSDIRFAGHDDGDFVLIPK